MSRLIITLLDGSPLTIMTYDDVCRHFMRHTSIVVKRSSDAVSQSTNHYFLRFLFSSQSVNVGRHSFPPPSLGSHLLNYLCVFLIPSSATVLALRVYVCVQITRFRFGRGSAIHTTKRCFASCLYWTAFDSAATCALCWAATYTSTRHVASASFIQP